MLQVNYIREHKEEVLKGLAVKNFKQPELVEEVLKLDEQRRQTQTQLDSLLAEGNAAAKQIGELMRQGKKDEAIKAFSDITQRFPALPEPYNNLAVLYADQGQFDKAKQALESAIKTHPSYATAHENLGDIYSKMASEAYGKALQLDTANARAQNKLLLIKDLLSTSGKTALAVNAKPTHLNTTTLPPSTDSAYGSKVADSIKATESGKINTKSENTNDIARADTQSVVNAVNKWANAWSTKNIDAYLDALRDSEGEKFYLTHVSMASLQEVR
jgi:tetratricopeptide (TPR) repeat protein